MGSARLTANPTRPADAVDRRRADDSSGNDHERNGYDGRAHGLAHCQRGDDQACGRYLDQNHLRDQADEDASGHSNGGYFESAHRKHCSGQVHVHGRADQAGGKADQAEGQLRHLTGLAGLAGQDVRGRQCDGGDQRYTET
jgi:hypothetical protein